MNPKRHLITRTTIHFRAAISECEFITIIGRYKIWRDSKVGHSFKHYDILTLWRRRICRFREYFIFVQKLQKLHAYGFTFECVIPWWAKLCFVLNCREQMLHLKFLSPPILLTCVALFRFGCKAVRSHPWFRSWQSYVYDALHCVQRYFGIVLFGIGKISRGWKTL